VKYLGALLLACAVSASAAIVVSEGNDGALPDSNVVYNGTGTSTTAPVVGRLNNEAFLIGFASSDALIADAQGQSRVEAVDGSFSDLSFFTMDASAFSTAIFNLNVSNPPLDGQVSFTFIIDGGVVDGGTFNLGNGVNRFNVQANAGEKILAVQFLSTTPIADLRQLRIGMVSDENPGGEPAVPEPLSMGLLGSGLGVLGLIRKYRNA
jgi:hypothetical protein